MVESKQQEQQEVSNGERGVERCFGEQHYDQYEDFMDFMLEEWQTEEDDVYTYNFNDFDDHDNMHIRLGMLIGQLDTHRFNGECEENLYDLQYLIHRQLDRIFNN